MYFRFGNMGLLWDTKKDFKWSLNIYNGREDRIWTCNPLVPNQVLYQVEPFPDKYGALEGIRTPDLLVRSQTLYPAELRAHALSQLIQKKWWLQRESNQRHRDFQSLALPTELWSQKKWRSRRESNSRSSAWQADVITATLRNQMVAGDGFEPTTFGLWAQRATKLLYPAILLFKQ